jgi:hypothetical protein
MTRYLLLFDSYGLVFVGSPLWREDGSVFCTCCWSLPSQSSSGPSSLGLTTIFTVSDLRLPLLSPLTTRRVTVGVFNPASITAPTAMVITSRHGPHKKHRSIVEFTFVAARVFTEPLPRNCRYLQRLHLATGLYATIWTESTSGQGAEGKICACQENAQELLYNL